MHGLCSRVSNSSGLLGGRISGYRSKRRRHKQRLHWWDSITLPCDYSWRWHRIYS